MTYGALLVSVIMVVMLLTRMLTLSLYVDQYLVPVMIFIWAVKTDNKKCLFLTPVLVLCGFIIFQWHAIFLISHVAIGQSLVYFNGKNRLMWLSILINAILYIILYWGALYVYLVIITGNSLDYFLSIFPNKQNSVVIFSFFVLLETTLAVILYESVRRWVVSKWKLK